MGRDKEYEDWFETNKTQLIQTFVDLYCPDFDDWAREQYVDMQNEKVDEFSNTKV